MSIRSGARGIVVNNGRVLLTREVRENGRTTYVLPGGGQEQYETLEETVKRELLEECGLSVRPVRLAAVCEIIYKDEAFREKWPDYAHRLHNIFICELTGEDARTPSSPDKYTVGIVWMDIAEADACKDVYPTAIRGKIAALVNGAPCEYLGCEIE